MSDNKFIKEFEVHYYEVDRFGQLSPLSILNFLEESAIAHSESVGLGVKKLMEDRVGWVLNKWLVQIEKYPRWGDKIYVETWPSSFERFYAEREFLVKDSAGKPIAKARTLWIYLNIDKRRPARIPEHYADLYSLNSNKVIEEPFKKTELPDEFDFKMTFSVRKSDIDTNRHVNNKSYIEWVLESIPQDIEDKYELNVLEAEYLKEVGYGKIIDILSKCTVNSGEKVIYNSLISDSFDNAQLAKTQTSWKIKK